MADRRLRSLARSDAPEARARLLRERLRCGRIEEWCLELAAQLGDRASRAALGRSGRPEALAWDGRDELALRERDAEVSLRIGVAVVRCAGERCLEPPSDPARLSADAVQHVEGWLGGGGAPEGPDGAAFRTLEGLVASVDSVRRALESFERDARDLPHAREPDALGTEAPAASPGAREDDGPARPDAPRAAHGALVGARRLLGVLLFQRDEPAEAARVVRYVARSCREALTWRHRWQLVAAGEAAAHGDGAALALRAAAGRQLTQAAREALVPWLLEPA